MIKILFCALSVWCATAFGQVPSFRSFNPPQFSTNNFIVSLKDPLVVTNITVVSNLVSQTIYTTNLYATNLYVTNIFQDITFNGRVTFNTNVTFVTNVLGVIDPVQSNVPVGGSPGSWYTNIYMTNLTAGVSDVMTIPAGYYGFGVSVVGFNSTNTSSITISAYLHEGANYRRLGGNQAVATNSPAGGATSGFSRLFAPGDVIAVSNSITGMGLIGTWKFFPDTLPFVREQMFGLPTTATLLYQVPTNTVAVPIPNANITASNFSQMLFSNDSGTSRTWRVWIVPPGTSPDDSTLYQYTSNSSGLTSPVSIPYLHEGTAIYVASDSAGEYQSVILQMYEVPE